MGDFLTVVLNFTITLVVEALVFLLLGIRNKKTYQLLIIANILTNIPLNIFLLSIDIVDPLTYYLIVGACELFVILIEAFIYRLRIRRLKSALFISILCNIASFIIGFIITMIIN